MARRPRVGSTCRIPPRKSRRRPKSWPWEMGSTLKRNWSRWTSKSGIASYSENIPERKSLWTTRSISFSKRVTSSPSSIKGGENHVKADYFWRGSTSRTARRSEQTGGRGQGYAWPARPYGGARQEFRRAHHFQRRRQHRQGN